MPRTNCCGSPRALERSSGHPLATAILAAAKERGLELVEASEFDSPSGKGVLGKIEGRALAIGNQRFLDERGVDAGPLAAEAEAQRREGATAVFVAVDGRAAGVIAVADPIKATTPDAVRELLAHGVRVVMLTGDNRTTAEAVAAKLGIEEVEAEILPDRKAEIVARLRREGRVVAMAGDGVNDAPALAAADVGVAMGTGTDVAMESAGVTLLKGDLAGPGSRPPPLRGDDGQHPPEPVLRVRLQRRRRADRRRRSLPLLRPSSLARHRRRGDGAVLGQRDRQRLAASKCEALG